MRPGIKVIECGEDYQVLRFAWWWPESVIDGALENIRKDAALQGKRITTKRGHRIVRVEGKLCES